MTQRNRGECQKENDIDMRGKANGADGESMHAAATSNMLSWS